MRLGLAGSLGLIAIAAGALSGAGPAAAGAPLGLQASSIWFAVRGAEAPGAPWTPVSMAQPGMPGSPTAGDSSAAESLGTGRASGDTLPPARVIAVPRTARDSAAAARDPRRRPRFDQPRYVMLRSLVVPGWGQLHNGSWLKALGLAAGEVMLGVRIVEDERELRRLNRQIDALPELDERRNPLIEAYNHRLDLSVARRWWLGGLLSYALLDAYVDAHFKDFDIEFERDPALPPGTKPTGGRLGLRWRW